jgi:hypothetical protein
MCQIDFSVMQSPHVRPILVTLRKILPRPIPAALNHSSNCPFTQSGIGTVRTCPALPPKSTIAQCSSRCCRSSILRPTASCRLSPHASSNARSARSRFPLSSWLSGACQREQACSAVNQFPRRTPSFLTPLTRRMPAARSELSRPQSAASYASRRTAPRRRLTVPGAKLPGFQIAPVS